MKLFGFELYFRYELKNKKGEVVRRCDLHTPTAAFRSAKYESKHYSFPVKTSYSIRFFKRRRSNGIL